MRRTKTEKEKGITLVALIITIVVLLILAVVAISAIQNDGILGHAQNATGTYNNAITTINNYCNEVVTATDNEGVRSVGGTNNSASPYSSPNFDAHFQGSGDVASGDMQFEEDYVKLAYHEILVSNGEYFLASRSVEKGSGGDLQGTTWDIDFFSVKIIEDPGSLFWETIWSLAGDDRVYEDRATYGVRSVVINPQNYEIVNE